MFKYINTDIQVKPMEVTIGEKQITSIFQHKHKYKIHNL